MRTLEIVHTTRYDYSAPVILGDHRLMFRPRDSHDLRLLHTGLTIEPAARVRWIHDAFGNSIAIASFDGQTQRLELVSTIRLEHFGMPPDLGPIEEYAQTLPFNYLAEEAPDLARYVERHYPDPKTMVANWTKQFLQGEGDEGDARPETFATLERMCKGIQQGLRYAMRFEPGTKPPDATLESGEGTCRDYALLMMEGARAFGLAARFITGYLYDPALDETVGGKPNPAFAHAWTEVYLPGAGWVEFDPTNGIIGSERLIRVAVARHPEQAMPIKGTFTGAPDVKVNTQIDVHVKSLAAAEPAPSPAPSDGLPAKPSAAPAAGTAVVPAVALTQS
ncbi:MAG: transglutaminase family protein [Alphaproteobacteria bacterium]|nr:transglutaminase family protein [Alphaproteobacteria bacterium]